MEKRVFIKDTGSKFKKGTIKEYPPLTWKLIQQSAKAKSLDEFSRKVDDVVQEKFARG